ncbi:hypothetical protein L226DRAFT_573985 [Lentinus tigrinus ALCF2SS1-7]|uniref:SH3 domain-containing protein n=1 Tax=Lentinus tigrinus ALCF2SS1-6 TaxID=1328759 RepID=A0A5C2RZ59_9APHY|nr:hypothetical protein L227DRAFT_256724 [Lentinus tigrinus ALCF2SS1-6]RPD71517.1 hypothetical protein L226DRAFT_573985 [Lentinus tigrinus ALCF2SS1-7]
MAIINFASHARRNAEAHNAAHALLSRQPVADTQDGTPVVNPLPTSVKVLTAFFVILGVLIVGIVTWRVVVWRRRKVATTASQKYRQGSFSPSEKIRPIGEGTPLEKQEVLVILPVEPPPSVKATPYKWTPQVFAHQAKDNANVVDIKSPPAAEAVRSPPPTYTATSSRSPSPSSTPSSSPRPPALNLPAFTVTHDNNDHLTVPAVATPAPSPRRTSSFGMEGFGEQANLKAKPSIKGQKLPRKMLVEHTFIPSLADELSIKVGEVLNMLEEYEDEWCLVERIGSRAGERGVVPRFCLKERPRGHKRGQSSTSSASRNATRAQ